MSVVFFGILQVLFAVLVAGQLNDLVGTKAVCESKFSDYWQSFLTSGKSRHINSISAKSVSLLKGQPA